VESMFQRKICFPFVAHEFEFFIFSLQWEGDLNQIKDKVKGDIEDTVAQWSREEKDECVNATAAAFMGGGTLNSYLSGGQSKH
jgi:hypothetical protein